MRVTRMSGLLGTLLLSSVIGTGALQAAEPVNINTADAATLAAAIAGVGQKRAEAIVAYREANGPFRSVDDLVLVKGVGQKTLEQSRTGLTTGED